MVIWLQSEKIEKGESMFTFVFMQIVELLVVEENTGTLEYWDEFIVSGSTMRPSSTP